MSIYEYSAWVIGAVASGSSIEIASQAKGVALDHGGPMEPIFINHVAHAAAGLTRQEANRIVQGLLAKYEDSLPTPPAGKPYQDCYDLASGEPIKEFVELHRELRKEMTDQFGLKFSAAFPYL
jgi:methylamine--corrinoid protein Co-methyltransferase